MADMLQFQLVSPERKLAAVAASRVQIPGVNGDFTAMPNHAPYLTTLRPGVVRVVTPTETTEYVVTGGFAEVSADATTIIAETAVPPPKVVHGLDEHAGAGGVVVERARTDPDLVPVRGHRPMVPDCPTEPIGPRLRHTMQDAP